MSDVDRIWLKNYPPGVPADIDPAQFASLVELFEASFARFGSRPAHTMMGADLSYAEFDRRSLAVAAWLQSRGVQRGDRVAIMLPNVLQFPVAMLGILRAGAVVVNINPLYTARELEAQLKDAGARTLFVLENFAHTVQAVQPRTAVQDVVLCSMGEVFGGAKGLLVDLVVRHVKKMVPPYELPALRFAEVVRRGEALALQRPALGPDDLAFLQYTGGTTGVSKGAMLTHRNVVANVLQVEAWNRDTAERKLAGQAMHLVTALPLYHIFALTCCAMYAARVGGLCILVPNPRDVPALVKELARRPFHSFPAVNTLFNLLAADPGFGRLDFSGLLASNGGGMAVQKAVADRWQALTGCSIVEGYGLSETSPVVTTNPPGGSYNGSIGLPMPSTELAILDDAGARLPLGSVGEIAVRGPQVMAGYWQRPDETARVMSADGFFRTGDIGVMDEQGYTRIVDRKKDMILVSGFNVYPNEVEAVVAMHPGVHECAVVGVPDEHSGEAVKLFVVRKDPGLTEAALHAFCKENLTGYKRPRIIEFRGELPKTNVGKILRRALRDGAPQPAA